MFDAITDFIGENTGLVAGGLGLFGNYQSSQAAKDAAAQISATAQQAADTAAFRPYAVSTGFGTSFFDADKQRAMYELDPALQALRDQYMMMGAQGLPTSMDPTANAQQYYNEMQTMMEPTRLQENQQMKQDLFGSGRLGMRLAGEAAGAGANSGMYQPDVLGMNKARELANQQLAQAARSQSMTELDQSIARGTGLMQTGLGIEQMGLTPLELGAQLGGYNASASGAASQALLQGGMSAAQANLAAGLNSSNLFGNLGLGLMQYNKPVNQISLGG